MEEHKAMSKETIAARIRGEQVRTLENIAARTKRPQQAWWLSFAGDDGFHGAVIVHATDFTEALMEATLHNCNPHGQCQGLEVPDGSVIPDKWKYRILNREQCEEFDEEMLTNKETAIN